MMKNLTLILVFTIGLSTAGFCQCDKKLILTSSTTEYLDNNNVVEHSVQENTTIKINKSESVTIAPGEEPEMKGVITQQSCDWKVPYKEGISVIKATMSDESGDTKHATITLEGKDGKVTLVVEVEEMPGKKIKVTSNSFGEEK